MKQKRNPTYLKRGKRYVTRLVGSGRLSLSLIFTGFRNLIKFRYSDVVNICQTIAGTSFTTTGRDKSSFRRSRYVRLLFLPYFLKYHYLFSVAYDPRNENPSLTLFGSRDLVRASLRSSLKDEICAENPPKTLHKVCTLFNCVG